MKMKKGKDPTKKYCLGRNNCSDATRTKCPVTKECIKIWVNAQMKKIRRKKGYVWIESYYRKKKQGQRKVLQVTGYWRKRGKKKEKHYIDV